MSFKIPALVIIAIAFILDFEIISSRLWNSEVSVFVHSGNSKSSLWETSGIVIIKSVFSKMSIVFKAALKQCVSAPLVDETVVDSIIPAIQTALNEDRATLQV